jgi:steroid delta-isomerase-like uncharacterized protein
MNQMSMTMKKLIPIFSIMLVLAVSGCAPQLDLEAEREAIHKFHDECITALLAGNVDCFAEEAQFLPPNAHPLKGKKAIGELVSQMIEDPNFSGSHDIVNVEVSRSGDLATIHYTYELNMSDPDGNPVTEHGKAIYVLKKQSQGGWKILIDIWNSEIPLLGAADTGKKLVAQVLALIDQRNLDEAFELYAPDYIYHGPGGQELRGRDGIRGLWEVFLVGFPDLNSTIEDMISAGDKVVLRWRIDGTHTGEFLGIAPSNRKISLDVTEIFRFANGQLVEAWDQYDRLGLMQQIGAIPMPDEASAE